MINPHGVGTAEHGTDGADVTEQCSAADLCFSFKDYACRRAGSQT